MTILFLIYAISLVVCLISMTLIGMLTGSDELVEYDLCFIPLVNTVLMFVLPLIVICTITLVILGEEV